MDVLSRMFEIGTSATNFPYEKIIARRAVDPALLCLSHGCCLILVRRFPGGHGARQLRYQETRLV